MKKSTLFRIRIALLATTIAFGFSACTGGGEDDGESNGERTGVAPAAPLNQVVIRVSAEPNVLNPVHDQSDAYSQTILGDQVFETLIARNNRTLEFEPNLAESWEESPDHLTFTFKLRRDVKWHDGKPFTARDVVATFALLKNENYAAAALGSYFVDCESCEALDDYTVRFIYSKSYFLALSVCGGLPIMPAHRFANFDEPGDTTQKQYDSLSDATKSLYDRNPIGTGPYRFVEWKSNTSIAFERFEDYWGKKPSIERVIHRVITDQNTAVQALKNGELDVVPRVETEVWLSETNTEDFKNRFNKFEYDFPSYAYIGWNQRRPLFQDKRLRQAMTMLIDREGIVQKLYQGAARVVSGPFFYKLPANNAAIEPWPFDPTRAQALLAEAGWKDSNDDGVLDKDGLPLSFEFLYTSSSKMGQRIGAVLQQEMRKAGIDVRLANLEWGTLLDRVAEKRDFDCVTMGWAMNMDNDPNQLWHSSYADTPNSSNHIGFKNEEADRLISLIRDADTTHEERIVAYHDFHALLHEEQPYTFLLSRKEFLAAHKKIQGIDFFAPRPCYDIREWRIGAAQPVQ